ncbi:MAG TPA: asparaginase [Candidatus Limnocylindrales bacterium]|nr:asparaginase [Candidatus Limnocylindrales bacterium]
MSADARSRPSRGVAVVFTGGTISMIADPHAGGNVPVLDGREILARTPGLDELAMVVPVDLGRTPASHFTLTDLLGIAERIRELARDPEIDGIVVVQGTDTIEETAFCWDLVHEGPTPIVVTGAMRAASDPGYEGPANVRDAVAVAAHAAMAGEGVVVVLGGTIEAADDVAKTHTSLLTTFRSPNAGPLGTIDGGQVHLARRRTARRHVAARRAPERVHLITVTTGMDGSLIRAAVAAGADGLVVAATGSGNTSPATLEAAAEAIAAGVPVVLTTRCLGGCVSTAYAFPGGGATWARAGAILAGHLSGPKARVALALGIGAGLDDAGLRALLADPWPAR